MSGAASRGPFELRVGEGRFPSRKLAFWDRSLRQVRWPKNVVPAAPSLRYQIFPFIFYQPLAYKEAQTFLPFKRGRNLSNPPPFPVIPVAPLSSLELDLACVHTCSLKLALVMVTVTCFSPRPPQSLLREVWLLWPLAFQNLPGYRTLSGFLLPQWPLLLLLVPADSSSPPRF